MSEFYEIIKESFTNPLFILTFLFFLSGFLLIIKFLYLQSTGKVRGKEKLFKLFDSKFNKGLIKDKEDITILINSISREYEREFSFAPILEDYLAYLTEKDYSKEKSEPDILTNYYNLVKEIIHQENEEKPFANIPEEERRLLKSIEDSVKHNETDAIQFNLQELNSVIATRNRIYKRTDKINRWSIPIAIIGIIFTIIFGFMSLSPRFDYKKIEQINKDLIKNIKVDTLNTK